MYIEFSSLLAFLLLLVTILNKKLFFYRHFANVGDNIATRNCICKFLCCTLLLFKKWLYLVTGDRLTNK